VNFESPSSLVNASAPRGWWVVTAANLALAIGCAVLILPTMYEVATKTWTGEQGGHGPLVLATGLWAVWREVHGKGIERRAGNAAIGVPLLVLALGLFVIARITGILEIEAFLMYGAVISGAYLLFGGAVMRAIWFPLVYLAFALPPPDTVVAFVTQPIKIAISTWAVSLLQLLGYPIASSGVTIQIAQYQLLVAAACAGLNSIVTLTALCVFYVYLRRRSDPIAFLVIAIAAIPVAIIANFVRVIALVLITYYFGDAVAQGFVHDFAGLLMFSVALLAVFGIDQVASPIYAKNTRETAA
jgi:exosortase